MKFLLSNAHRFVLWYLTVSELHPSLTDEGDTQDTEEEGVPDTGACLTTDDADMGQRPSHLQPKPHSLRAIVDQPK